MLLRPLFLFLGLCVGLGQWQAAQAQTNLPEINRLILNAIGRMPTGGQYATNAHANSRLAASIRCEADGLTLSPDLAQPSYCSGATYLVFLAAVDQLARRGTITLGAETLRALAVRGQRDGEGVWGRWNANGPGTARLFAEARLGRSFTDWSQARPGDFMKIWWNNEIGQRERGHSVIFLGTEQTATGPTVLFWSSNQPDGYGRRSIPRSKVKWAVFSRFESPEAVANLATLPKRDAYLASMLTRPSTRAEVATQSGFRE
jgi:hypothetical protein